MNATDLFKGERHEVLTDAAWSADAARAAIHRIVDSSFASFERTRGWPFHSLDDGPPGEPKPMLYFGTAGVVWALDHLARSMGTRAPDESHVQILRAAANEAAAAAEERMKAPGSLHWGATGVLMVEWRLTRDTTLLDRIASLCEGAIKHPANDLCWGSPGAMLASLWLHEATHEPRWADLFVRGARHLLGQLETNPSQDVRLWQQHLYGFGLWLIGAGHGLATNALSILRGERLLGDLRAFRREVAHTVTSTAVRAEGLANWPKGLFPATPPEVGASLPDLLVQYCHGAPGMIIGLAESMPELAPQMLEAGELTWRAGPLRKGGGICHGTAGNGYAFLKLWKVTGDPKWLERARSFAMHALGQSEAARGEPGRWSLWTGDPGIACFVADCISGRAEVPTLDVF